MKLIAYNSSEGGGMNGGYSSISIAYTEDGRCVVIKSNRAFHNQPMRTVKYFADGLLERLSEVCRRYDVIHWTDLPAQTAAMLDAPSGSDCFTFEDGTKIVINNGAIHPQKVRDMYQEFMPLIRESEAYGTNAEATEEKPAAMTMGMFFAQTNQVYKVQTSDRPTESVGRNNDTSEWAGFCGNCGAKFSGNQKFCAECGEMRQKR